MCFREVFLVVVLAFHFNMECHGAPICIYTYIFIYIYKYIYKYILSVYSTYIYILGDKLKEVVVKRKWEPGKKNGMNRPEKQTDDMFLGS